MTEPAWVVAGRRWLGAAEIPGSETAPMIRGWLLKLGAWWKDDETPWCGTFVAACLRETGQPIPKHWFRARAYLDWGVTLRAPAVGAIVIYERGGAGHVGFVVGLDKLGNLMTLGGNQGNRVSIAPFSTARVLGYRWPSGFPMNAAALPILSATGPLSTKEA